jgi:hypothetical protein
MTPAVKPPAIVGVGVGRLGWEPGTIVAVDAGMRVGVTESPAGSDGSD